MTAASEAIFASDLREIAGSEDTGFVALARLAGLDPRRDFRFADLSGVDLRGEDLREFDLTGARLDGARILGARLPRSVTGRQKRRAIETGRTMTILVGERLHSDEREIAARVGVDVFVPPILNEALRKSEADIHRRTRRTGAFIGDNSDLVRRRIKGALKTAPLPSHAATVILAEPESDFDFDALLAVVSMFDRLDQRPFVVLLPHLMSISESGSKIVRARAAALNPADMLAFAPEIEGPVANPRREARVRAQALADRSLVLDFMVAAAAFKPAGKPTSGRFSGVDEVVRPRLTRGTRRARENLEAAIQGALATRGANYSGRTRRVVMLREDMFQAADASRIAFALLPMAGACHIGSYPAVAGDQAEFYVVDAQPRSHLWGIFPQL